MVIFVSTEWIFSPKQCFGEHSAPGLASCSVTWTPISFFLPTQTPRSCVRFIAVSGMYLACPQKTCWVGYPHPNSSIRVHVTPAPCASPDSSDSWKLWDGNQCWLGRATTRRTEFGSLGSAWPHMAPSFTPLSGMTPCLVQSSTSKLCPMHAALDTAGCNLSALEWFLDVHQTKILVIGAVVQREI